MVKLRLAVLPAVATLLIAAAAPVLAHQGSDESTLAVDPTTVTAGGTIVLAGSGMEPDDDRILVLAGSDMTIQLGTATTDAEGMFNQEIVIPAHVPAGAYELQAIGDETITTPLAVTAAAGEPAASAPPAQDEEIVPRERSGFEFGFIVVFVLASLALGVFLVLRAEHFRGEARG